MDAVTIFSSTFLGMGIGRHVEKLIRNGPGPLDSMNSGPFVEYLPFRKRRLRTVCDDQYLLILKGTDIPDPPDPFVTEISSPYASGFSPLMDNDLSLSVP